MTNTASNTARYSLGLPLEAGRMTINHVDDGRPIPVLTVELLDATVPLGVERLAANAVSLLNGHAAGHRLELGDGARMHYHRAASGIFLTRHDGEPGVSQPLAGILASAADPVRAGAALRALDNLVMASLCATADGRRAPQPEGGGPRQSGPTTPRQG